MDYIFVTTGFKGDCIITMKDSDFMDLVLGKIGAQKVPVYMYMCTCTMYLYTFVCIYIHVQLYIHTYIYTCTYICTCTYMYIIHVLYIHTYIYTCTYICTCTYMYIIHVLYQGIGIEAKMWNDSIQIQITNASFNSSELILNLRKFQFHSIRTQIPFQLLQVVLLIPLQFHANLHHSQ